jgi:hypothetical protein
MKSPCPTCGCELYKEQGPCEGSEELKNASVHASHHISWLKHRLRTAGIAELAVDNPNLNSYMKEWERRTTQAEAIIEGLEKLLAAHRVNSARIADQALTKLERAGYDEWKKRRNA